MHVLCRYMNEIITYICLVALLMFWHLFLDSSLKDTSEEPIESKKCRPTNLDEVELDQNSLIENADTNNEISNN